MKKNSADNYDHMEVTLSPERFPIAYEAKIQELIGQGNTREEAESFAPFTIEMELYYSVDQGLFMVEADAVDCIDIYNPYTGHKMGESEESLFPTTYEERTWCCEECGSTDITVEVWVNPNAPGKVITKDDWDETTICGNDDCASGGAVNRITVKEFNERKRNGTNN